MLKLLTKFKTQSLNEVVPYENNGSFVSFCGEVRNSVDGVPEEKWPQDGFEPDETNGGPNINNQASFASTCFISRLPSELVKTYQSPREMPFDEGVKLECENKENGDKRASGKRRIGVGLSAEKRKWSQVKGSRSSLQQGSDSSSSDEEVKELFSKQQRSEHTDNLKENWQTKAVRSGSKVRPCERKRHRLTTEDRIYRPSLDFEKMQQKAFWKKATSRARIVKVRSFYGHPHNLFPDPSVVSFKPIQAIQTFKLTPVEEPRALAF